MTNTLTISRALLEKCLDGAASMGWSIADDLRALLAQADDADKVNNREMGLMQFVEKHAAPANQYQRCTILKDCNVRSSASSAAPAVERQPIAEVQHGPFDDVGAPQWVRVVTLGDFDLEHIPDGTKLWASPPAPVAVEGLKALREYHSGAVVRLRRYAADAVARKSDAEHYNKRADVHLAFVLTLDGVLNGQV